MTAQVNVTGTRRPIGLTPSDTNEATIFTAGEAVTTLVQFWVANLTATAATTTIKWGDGSTDYPLISVFSVPARGYLREDCMIPLRPGYTVKVTSGTSSALTYSVIITEAAGGLGGKV